MTFWQNLIGLFKACCAGLGIFLASGLPVLAGQVTVAVASNFLPTAQVLSQLFETNSGHRVVLVHGSTGRLYAQIVNGAPFDVFLSADVARARALEDADLALARTGYAVGKLVFVSRLQEVGKPENLRDITAMIAMADPETAPYGAAAKDVLIKLRGIENWNSNVVLGESVAQAFGFVATGNADIGFVAKSQLTKLPADLSWVEIPADWHAPILQDAVLLRRAADNLAAQAFFTFLGEVTARQTIAAAGYGLPE